MQWIEDENLLKDEAVLTAAAASDPECKLRVFRRQGSRGRGKLEKSGAAAPGIEAGRTITIEYGAAHRTAITGFGLTLATLQLKYG